MRIKRPHIAGSEMQLPGSQSALCCALLNAGMFVMSLLLTVCFCADGDAEEHDR